MENTEKLICGSCSISPPNLTKSDPANLIIPDNVLEIEHCQFYGIIPLRVNLVKNRYIDELCSAFNVEIKTENKETDVEHSESLHKEVNLEYEFIQLKNEDVDIKHIWELENW